MAVFMSVNPINALEIKLEAQINEYLAAICTDSILQHDEKKVNQAIALRRCIGKITSE